MPDHHWDVEPVGESDICDCQGIFQNVAGHFKHWSSPYNILDGTQ